ncbi:MAG: M48 family metalloprotease [Deltaproteobacteria bacterium]|nr:M48 family metalloprotease [Deltaproteobacteria bacterium]
MKRRNQVGGIVVGFLFFGALVGPLWALDMGKLTSAGQKGLSAVMLSDAEMVAMAVQGIAEMDAQNQIAAADSPHTRRLAVLTSVFKEVNGRPLHFKVYEKEEINAFAMPDGSIRIYSGLMEMMNDGELLFIVGHEIGHVARGHAKKRFQVVYGTSSLRDVVGGVGGRIGSLAGGVAADFLEKVVNAQFSQANEREADDFGFQVLREQGMSGAEAVSALEKLDSPGEKAGFLERMLATHPEPGARALRLREKLGFIPAAGN